MKHKVGWRDTTRSSILGLTCRDSRRWQFVTLPQGGGPPWAFALLPAAGCRAAVLDRIEQEVAEVKKASRAIKPRS